MLHVSRCRLDFRPLANDEQLPLLTQSFGLPLLPWTAALSKQLFAIHLVCSLTLSLPCCIQTVLLTFYALSTHLTHVAHVSLFPLRA